MVKKDLEAEGSMKVGDRNIKVGDTSVKRWSKVSKRRDSVMSRHVGSTKYTDNRNSSTNKTYIS